MKNKHNHSPARIFCVVVLGIGTSLRLTTAATFSDANWSGMGGIPGTDSYVRAAEADASGNLYVGGNFAVAGDVIANQIAKWDGTNWSALGSGMGGGLGDNLPNVAALAVSGSDLYAGGSFTTAGGIAVNSIAKWNGSSWSALGSGMGSAPSSFPGVGALAVSGGNLYVGGSFTTAGGIAATNIAKWDGTSWSALGSGLNGHVFALAVIGNDVYAGGNFTTAGGIAASNIARWNGSSWSAVGLGMGGAFPGLSPSVYSLAVLGSDLYAAGEFRTAGGLPANYVAKWNGTNWSALGLGMNGHVFALAALGNDLYASGQFEVAGSSLANNIAKWNGTSWSALGLGVDHGFADVLAVSGSTLYAAGSFRTAGGNAARYVAQWKANTWSSLGSGINYIVYGLAVSGSNVFAGGEFRKAGGVLASAIARWNGSSWSAMGTGMGGPVPVGFPTVFALAVSGTNLFAGGSFRTASGIVASNIARWNGITWSALGSGMNHAVFALAVSGSSLFAGGGFTRAGGIAATNIARWNGSSWSALGLGMNGPVYALAMSGSDLYAAGSFSRAGTIAANNIAKWNGSSWSALSSGLGGDVTSLAVIGSDVYAAGFFETAGGIAASNIAKWNGTNWSAVGSGINSDDGYPEVFALASSGSDLYAVGYFFFTAAGGSVANYIAKWDGTNWSALGSGLGGSVNGFPYVLTLAVSGSDLYVGGDFSTAGGKVAGCIARAYLPPLPALSVLRSGADVTVSWRSADTAGFALEQAGALVAPTTWITNTTSVTDDGTKKSVTQPATNSPQYFRLRRP